jgi:hypothetical protein
MIDHEAHNFREEREMEAHVRKKTNVEILSRAPNTRLQDEGNEIFIEKDGRTTKRSNQEELTRERRDLETDRRGEMILHYALNL